MEPRLETWQLEAKETLATSGLLGCPRKERTFKIFSSPCLVLMLFSTLEEFGLLK